MAHMFSRYSGTLPPDANRTHCSKIHEITPITELVHQSLFPTRLRKSMFSEQLTGQLQNRRQRRNAVYGGAVLIPPKCAFCNGIESSLIFNTTQSKRCFMSLLYDY